MNKAPPCQNGSRRSCRSWMFLLAGFLFLIGCVQDPVSGEQFLLGWLYFPLENLPRMTVDWPTVILAAIALPLFAGLLASGLRRRFPRRSAAVASLLTSGLLVLFVAGTASIGLGHQVVWLCQGSGPKGEGRESRPLPGVVTQAERAQRLSKTKNDLKFLALAAHNFESAYRSLPAGGTLSPEGRPLHGWLTFIGMFGGISTSSVDLRIPWNEGSNADLFRCQMMWIVNPSIPELFDEEGYGLSHVAANVRVMPIVVDQPAVEGAPRRAKTQGLRFDEIRDGMSQTILLGQVTDQLAPWGSPRNVRDPARGMGTPDGFSGGPAQQGTLFTMADGSVRLLSNQTAPRVLAALATPTGGEQVPDPLE